MTESITVYETAGHFFAKTHEVLILEPPVTRVLRASMQAWRLLGPDPRHEGRVLIRGCIVRGRVDVVSVSQETWDDPRDWRYAAADGDEGNA